jgi:hypothetical protein
MTIGKTKTSTLPMDVQEVLKLADDIVFAKTGKHLDHQQEGILRGTWQRQKYP